MSKHHSRSSVRELDPAEANKSIVRSIWDAWNKRDWAQLEMYFDSSDVAGNAPPRPRLEHRAFSDDASKDTITATVTINPGILTVFPDARVTIEDLIADGEKVVARARWRGTHQERFMPLDKLIPATGKRIEWTAIYIYHILNGKIHLTWENVDHLSILQQLET